MPASPVTTTSAGWPVAAPAHRAAGQRRGPRAPHREGGGRRGRLRAQHGEEQRLRGGRGVAAEQLGHRTAQRTVGHQRGPGPPGAVVGEHDGAARLLVDGVLAQHDGGDLDRGVVRAHLARGGAPAHAGPAQPPPDVAAQVAYPGILPLTGQRNVGLEQLRGLLGARAGQRVVALRELVLCGRDQLGGSDEIDLDVLGGQPVRGCAALDAVAAQCPAQAADQRGDVAVGPLGCGDVPQRVDERLHRHELPAADREHGEHPSGLSGRQRCRQLALDGQRAEQAQPQVRRAHEPTLPTIGPGRDRDIHYSERACSIVFR